DYYRALGLPQGNLSAVVKDDAGHTLPTPDFGNACSVTGEPYLVGGTKLNRKTDGIKPEAG
ncbi:MAG: hypothetical protein PHU46_11640, partial [Rhodocyclaceae bacterium]|nr:hypothetical protein [Rhodocyclaceae bacterium]